MPPVDNDTDQLKYITRITTNNGDNNIKLTIICGPTFS